MSPVGIIKDVTLLPLRAGEAAISVVWRGVKGAAGLLDGSDRAQPVQEAPAAMPRKPKPRRRPASRPPREKPVVEEMTREHVSTDIAEALGDEPAHIEVEEEVVAETHDPGAQDPPGPEIHVTVDPRISD